MLNFWYSLDMIVKNMKKFILIFIFIISLFLSMPCLAMAQDSTISDGLIIFGDGLNLPNSDLTVVVSNLINAGLSLAGLFLVGIFLYGGLIWMLALGDETKVEKAKGAMIQGVIGLVIIMMSYSLANYLITALNTATGS
jgi:hypothetical protein